MKLEFGDTEEYIKLRTDFNKDTKSMAMLNKVGYIKWLEHKLVNNINYTRCCKSDSEQLCANCLCKPTQKLGFCNECFDNIYSRA